MREEKAARREMNDHTTLMAPMKPIILSAFALAAIAGSTFGAMDESTIAAGLKSHDRALHLKDGWMRDCKGESRRRTPPGSGPCD